MAVLSCRRNHRLEQALEKVRRAARGPEPQQLRQLFERFLADGDARSAGAPRITARGGDSVHVFDPGEIARFPTSHGYTAFSIRGEEFLLDEGLQQLTDRLTPLGFLRVHRAELVRLDAVRALHNDGASVTVALDDGQGARVSRRLVAELKRRLGID
jgi:two-component system LytT family response regulator